MAKDHEQGDLIQEIRTLRETIELTGTPLSTIAEYLTTVVDDMRSLKAQIKDLEVALKKSRS